MSEMYWDKSVDEDFYSCVIYGLGRTIDLVEGNTFRCYNCFI